MDFHINYKLLIAAYDNFTCKIMNYESQQVVKTLSITDKNLYDLNFHSALYLTLFSIDFHWMKNIYIR